MSAPLDPTIVVPPHAQEADVLRDRKLLRAVANACAAGVAPVHELEGARACIAALQREGYVIEPGWQPISSAPKDGTQVLMFGRWRPHDILPGGEPCMLVASWSTIMSNGTGYAWLTACGTQRLDNINVELTMWRPLPAPPQQQEQP